MANSNSVKTILTIEDEPDVRYFVSRVLELEGYHVIQAEDGDAGLIMARENEVSLVLLDLRLPERDGWSVLNELKGKSAILAIPVIVLTANAESTVRSRALNMGADDYLVKPISASALRKAVAKALKRKGPC